MEKIEYDLPHVDEEFFFGSLKDFFGKKYAVVMLGCTHFIYVKKVVQSIFPMAELKDGTESLFEKTDIFLTKSLGQTATEQQCGKISEKNFIGEDSARNFWLFRRLTNSKSH